MLSVKEVNKAYADAAAAKAKKPIWIIFLMAVNAGILLGCGGAFAVIVAGGLTTPSVGINTDNPGLTKLVAGSVFPLGLILIVSTGSELITGSFMVMTIGLLERRIRVVDLLINWAVTWIGNYVGSVLFAFFLVYLAEITKTNPWNSYAVSVTNSKTTLGWGEAFLRGVGCNFMVCHAVYFAASAKDAISKIFCIWWPIAAFVAIGWEHCVANMFYLSLGLMDHAPQNYGYVLGKNLIPVTLGNMFSGCIMVGVVMWASVYEPQPPAAVPTSNSTTNPIGATAQEWKGPRTSEADF